MKTWKLRCWCYSNITSLSWWYLEGNIGIKKFFLRGSVQVLLLELMTISLIKKLALPLWVESFVWNMAYHRLQKWRPVTTMWHLGDMQAALRAHAGNKNKDNSQTWGEMKAAVGDWQLEIYWHRGTWRKNATPPGIKYAQLQHARGIYQLKRARKTLEIQRKRKLKKHNYKSDVCHQILKTTLPVHGYYNQCPRLIRRS